ncbi:MAG: VWA domain-containing protein [Erysipelotrichaceae bacterium]|nr:VWA domain-containing protein [Erysipelotrichaceae bacterium]
MTELVFILDRSGSMSGMEEDVIGGFNSMIEKQKKEKGEAYVTTVTFNMNSETIHDRIPINDVGPLSGKDYYPCGSTALLDTVGYTIKHIESIHRYIRKEDRPDNVIFVITTDGLENSSQKYSYQDVKKMISNCKKKDWEFIFLGANIDAVKEARNFGIGEEWAVNYVNDKKGISIVYDSLDSSIRSVRRNGHLSEDWKMEIEEDFKTRKGQ